MKQKKLFAKVTAGAMAFSMTLGVMPLTVSAQVVGEWREESGKLYWYENGIKQGYDANNEAYRGKEIYDPGTNAWYWLDNVQGGAKAVSKDVYQESLAGEWGDYVGEDGQKYGKWVRYDAEGHMMKGWNTNESGTYYFDPTYGTMAKGVANINGVEYTFDAGTGVLQHSAGGVEGNANGWRTINGVEYWYENGVRQGTEGRGKEIYDPGTNAWYWLDAVDGGAKAVNKDVYQESKADDAGTIGKWVRYDGNGHMIKGWSADGLYYFHPTYGTMAKGNVTIDGVSYYFDEYTGVCQNNGNAETRLSWELDKIIEYAENGDVISTYAYSYDTDGDTKSCTYTTSDSDGYTSYYDEQGRETECIYTFNYGDTVSYARYVYFYDGDSENAGKIITYYKDSDASEWLTDEIEVTTYNEQGDILTYKRYYETEDAAGLYSEYENKYDDKNQIVESISSYYYDGVKEPGSRETYLYDENGNLVEECLYAAGTGDLRKKIIYKYNDKNELTESVETNYFDGVESWKSTDLYEYDENSNCIKETTYDNDNKVTSVKETTYADVYGRGWHSVTSRFYLNGDGVVNSGYEYLYENGNRVRINNYGKNKELINYIVYDNTDYPQNVAGAKFSQTDCQYNGSGMLIGKTVYEYTCYEFTK